jgi:hypothetical protein
MIARRAIAIQGERLLSCIQVNFENELGEHINRRAYAHLERDGGASNVDQSIAIE